jgi:hypothetical protein
MCLGFKAKKIKKLPEYATFEDKAKHFNAKNIETEEEFNNLLEELPQKKYIFRGLNEAKYKLYNSAQRFFLMESDRVPTENDYHNFIQTEINSAKTLQNDLLKKYYDAYGHVAYDLSILSFLQHYGGITPMLDFTDNSDYALFFAIDGLNVNKPTNEIDDFFSIYAIDKDMYEFPVITKHIDREIQILNNGIKNLPAHIKNKLDTSYLDKIKKLDYDSFKKYKLFYLPGYVQNGLLYEMKNVPDFKLIYNQHNLNIINQEGGLFFYSSPTSPLEEYFESNKEYPFSNPEKIHCWNIHKKLEYNVKAYLTTKGIDKKFIYPQEENIAKRAFEKAKLTI